MSAGLATPAGRDDQGRAVFRVQARGRLLPGRFCVIDRELVKLED